MNKKYIISLLFTIATINLNAQVVGSSSFFDTIVSQWKTGLSFDSSFGATLPADFKDDSGELANYSTTQNLQLQLLKESHAINIGLAYTYNYYDFSQQSSFSSIEELSANIFYNYKINEYWGFFAIGLLKYSTESFSDMSDAESLMFSAGARYSFSESFSLNFGLMTSSRMDRSYIVIPIAFIDWKINKNLTLRSFNGVSLIYDVFGDKSLSISAICEYNSTYTRLSRTNTDNSLRDSYLSLSIGATYYLSKHLYLSLSIGAESLRQLEYRSNGDKVSKTKLDTSPTSYFHIGYKF